MEGLGKVIFLTGATGFLGSHLAAHLASQGHDVLALVRRTSRLDRLAEHSRIHRVEGDLNDAGQMRLIFQQHKPEVVIHAAWAGAAGPQRNDPSQEKNLIAARQLFELCAEFKCRRVIGIGSQAEYGIHNALLSETSAAHPQTLYGQCKYAAGQSGLELAKTGGFDYAWLRLFAVFGPGDAPGYLIPTVIRSMLAGEASELTACTQKWDYLYVSDAARLVERVICAPGPFQGIYNLCSGDPVVLKDLILLVQKVLGSTVSPRFGALPISEGALTYLAGDVRKFRETFGGIKLTPFEDAMKETVAWARTKGVMPCSK